MNLRNIYVTYVFMSWSIEYYEQRDTTQPADVFEDALDSSHPKLAGKLLRIVVALQTVGHTLGGGLIKPCHNSPGIWEIRAIHSQQLAREFFGFDGQQVILLHGYVKRSGEKAVDKEFAKAHDYWKDYSKTHKVSPVEEEVDESI